MSDDKSIDVLGIKPVATAVEKSVDALISGASAFLSRVCLPAAEELGALARDQVKVWRLRNMARITAEAEKLLGSGQDLKCNARVAIRALEEGSWTDDELLQSKWAGLLAASCTSDGSDDSNVVLTTLLSRITGIQARLLDYACQRCEKRKGFHDIVVGQTVYISIDDLVNTSGTADLQKLDMQIDNLLSIGLFEPLSGFNIDNHKWVSLRPSSLGLNLYVRCKGSKASVADFFNL